MSLLKRHWCIHALIVLALVCFSALLYAQVTIQYNVQSSTASQKIIQNAPSPDQRLKWYDEQIAMRDRSPYKDMRWSFIGPTNVSGRVTDIAVVTPHGKNFTIYIAVSSGGVWKTENEGLNWTPIFEQEPTASIGDVTLAPSNQNIVWVGTGEPNIFRSSHAGAGVYKSSDAGKTWQYMGLAGTQTIARIVIHPKNPDIVWVAAGGHEWTFNEDRGIFKTTDGGKTWKKILYINDQTGANDLVMDPTDPAVLYATTWQRIRRKWNDPRIEPGFKESSVYKTTDGGNTWKQIIVGLPAPEFRGRIGIDICLTKPNVLYAYIDNYEISPGTGGTDAYGRQTPGRIKGATVYRSDNKGELWTQMNNAQDLVSLSATYGWVFSQIRVDPNNDNKVYVMGVSARVSEDGGKTWQSFRTPGGDHHSMWIDPDNSNYIINGNDQGLGITYDGGKTFRGFSDKLNACQFYNVAYDMDTPFKVYGSVQDHGSYRGVVTFTRPQQQRASPGGRAGGAGVIQTTPQQPQETRFQAVQFQGASGGEGSSHAIDPTNPNILYSAGFYGSISRTDYSKGVGGEGESKSIMPRISQGEPPLRGQWVAPFIISPHDPNMIYHGMQYLFYSMHQGDTWERISPDLTYNTASEMGDIPYHTIFTISESPFKFGLIYIGTDDGKVQVTKDGGKTWKEIMKGLPYQKWVSRLVASQYDEATVYMSQTGKQDDDFTPYLWKSTDYGETWVSIAQGIPLGPINVVREDYRNRNILYVGTDNSVFVTTTGGQTWDVLGGSLPSVYVNDLIIHPRDNIIVLATYGRGMWAMDVQSLAGGRR